MKRFFQLLVVVIIFVPTGTWAKGGSYTRRAAIPIAASIATPASFTGRDIQASGDCGDACRNRSFRRAKAALQ
jgi:ketosteroid isomerase-like protein